VTATASSDVIAPATIGAAPLVVTEAVVDAVVEDVIDDVIAEVLPADASATRAKRAPRKTRIDLILDAYNL